MAIQYCSANKQENEQKKTEANICVFLVFVMHRHKRGWLENKNNAQIVTIATIMLAANEEKTGEK